MLGNNNVINIDWIKGINQPLRRNDHKNPRLSKWKEDQMDWFGPQRDGQYTIMVRINVWWDVLY